MSLVFYGVLIVIVVLILIFSDRKPAASALSEEIKLPYKKNDNFLSASELSFYHTLNTYIDKKAVICPKVALKEFIFIGNGVGRDYMNFKNKISLKHTDFVLCDIKTMQVICGVELDDKSHLKESRQKRDEFVDKVFEAASIPIFHIPAKSDYLASDLAEIIYSVMVQKTPILKKNDVNTEENESQIDSPLCSK